MTTDKVSLIIPIYNFEQYIYSTLESVFKQTYHNLEVIVVNDGSTDKSRQIVEKFQERHTELILINQKNQGVSVARNTGIENASGEFILFADADDILSPDYVAYLVSMAKKYDADISVSTGIITNYSFGNITKTDDSNTINIYNEEEALYKMLTYWFPIGCCCRAFRRKLFDNGLRFIPGQKVGEGFTFNIKAIMMANKVVVGNKCIYCYRRDNEDSCMTKFQISHAHQAVESINIIKSLFDHPTVKISKALSYAEWHTKGDMYNWIRLTDNTKNYPTECEEYKKVIRSFSKTAISQDISKKERLRAILQFLHPNLMSLLLIIRKRFSML